MSPVCSVKSHWVDGESGIPRLFWRSPMTPEYNIDYTDSQLPVSDKWLYVDPVYPEIFPA